MTSTARPRILIAEDDVLVGGMLRLTLELNGYTVLGQANNGEEVVAQTLALRPDLVVMDVAMPQRNGLEAARAIQAACPTPIIVVSAFDNAELKAEADASGVTLYMVKPVKAQDLTLAIDEALARVSGR